MRIKSRSQNSLKSERQTGGDQQQIDNEITRNEKQLVLLKRALQQLMKFMHSVASKSPCTTNAQSTACRLFVRHSQSHSCSDNLIHEPCSLGATHFFDKGMEKVLKIKTIARLKQMSASEERSAFKQL